MAVLMNWKLNRNIWISIAKSLHLDFNWLKDWLSSTMHMIPFVNSNEIFFLRADCLVVTSSLDQNVRSVGSATKSAKSSNIGTQFHSCFVIARRDWVCPNNQLASWLVLIWQTNIRNEGLLHRSHYFRQGCLNCANVILVFAWVNIVNFKLDCLLELKVKVYDEAFSEIRVKIVVDYFCLTYHRVSWLSILFIFQKDLDLRVRFRQDVKIYKIPARQNELHLVWRA